MITRAHRPLLACLLAIIAAAVPSAAQDSDILELHLLYTADIHGYVAAFPATWMNPSFPPPIGGGASAATYIKKIRARVEADPRAELLVMDAGDCWQGAPVGTLTEGRAVTDYFNALGFDLVAMGNHEFDHGWQEAREFSLSLDHKLVSCNTLDEETGELVDWVEPFRVFDRGGVRIGVIGAITTGTARMAFEENIRGIEFAPIAPRVEKYRKILQEQEGCDLVFLVVHEGLPHSSRLEEEWEELVARSKNGELQLEDAADGLELAHMLPGVPIMIGGHTHQGYEKPWIDPYTHVVFFEPYARGTAVGHVILKIDRATGQILGWDQAERDGSLVTLFEDQHWPDPEMSSILQPHVEEVSAQLQEVVGRSTVDLTRAGRSNSAMGNFVTECMRATFDADVAISNVGGLRTDIPRGEITMERIQELLPFGNGLVVGQVSGDLLKRIFERKASARSSGIYFSGARVVVDPRADEDRRLLSFEIGGEPVRPDKMYRLVTTDYLFEGNSNYDELTTVPDALREYTQVLTRDAVVRYLAQNSSISPRADDRYREETGGEMAEYLRDWPRSTSR